MMVGLLVLMPHGIAAAADLGPVLRGGQYEEPPLFYRWSGVYGGGQIGFSIANVDFTNQVRTLVADEIRLLTIEQDQRVSQWLVLPKKNPVGGSFGAFVGYNWQWEDAVVGVEVNYNRTSLAGSSGSSIERTFFDSHGLPPGHNYFYDVLVAGAASVRITDFGTFRVRGGWAAGAFLPYAFLGVAVGRFDWSRTASVNGTATDQPSPAPSPPPPATCISNCPLPNLTISEHQGDSRTGAFAYGGAVGLGVDVALLPNLFLRGEWELVQFAPAEHMHMRINTVRTALGLKF